MEQASAPAARVGGQFHHRLGRRVPRERCDPLRRWLNPQRDCRPSENLQPSSSLEPIVCPAFRDRNVAGIGPPGTAPQGTCGACCTTRTLLSGNVQTGGSSWGPTAPAQDLRIEGGSFRSACSLFPVARTSRLGLRPFIRRALDPQSRACRRSRRRTRRREPSRAVTPELRRQPCDRRRAPEHLLPGPMIKAGAAGGKAYRHRAGRILWMEKARPHNGCTFDPRNYPQCRKAQIRFAWKAAAFVLGWIVFRRRRSFLTPPIINGSHRAGRS